jgi:hypothetical protein
MGFSRNVGFLPRPCFGDPWCWSVVGAPTSHLPQAPPPTQRQLLTGPMGSAGGSPTKFGKSPATQPHVIYDAALPNDILLGRGKSIQNRPANVRFREMLDKHLEKHATGGNGAKAIFSTYIWYIS